jgi:hypothetical protein
MYSVTKKKANNIYTILSESIYKFIFSYNTASYVLYKAAGIL